jgi:hypothetical protein
MRAMRARRRDSLSMDSKATTKHRFETAKTVTIDQNYTANPRDLFHCLCN